MQRPHTRYLATMALAVVLAAGCGGSPDHDRGASDRSAPSLAERGTMAVAPPTTASPQDMAVLRVVDAYIREQTMEGAPYYIDSSATDFVGFEEDIHREDGRATCTARFTSDGDDFYVRFVLSHEAGSFVISRVILDRQNDRPVRRTLFDRDELVL